MSLKTPQLGCQHKQAVLPCSEWQPEGADVRPQENRGGCGAVTEEHLQEHCFYPCGVPPLNLMFEKASIDFVHIGKCVKVPVKQNSVQKFWSGIGLAVFRTLVGGARRGMAS